MVGKEVHMKHQAVGAGLSMIREKNTWGDEGESHLKVVQKQRKGKKTVDGRKNIMSVTVNEEHKWGKSRFIV